MPNCSQVAPPPPAPLIIHPHPLYRAAHGALWSPSGTLLSGLCSGPFCVAAEAAAVRRRRCVVGLPARGSSGAGRTDAAAAEGSAPGPAERAAFGSPSAPAAAEKQHLAAALQGWIDALLRAARRRPGSARGVAIWLLSSLLFGLYSGLRKAYKNAESSPDRSKTCAQDPQ